MIKIKICGMTDPDNVKEIAGLDPDFMGFIFYPRSKRYVGNNPDGFLFNTAPGILKTGIFVNEEPSQLIYIKELYGLDLIQLHGKESPEYCKNLWNKGLQLIKAFGLSSSFDFSDLEKYVEVCEYFLFDTLSENHGGSGLKFNWQKIYEYKINKPFFLSGGICGEDVQSIKHIDHENFYAVDINSRFETSPGIKDFRKVENFITAIRG